MLNLGDASETSEIVELKPTHERSELTLALASTLAPFLSKILMMSVWLARAARCSGVSPLTVASSGLAWFWIRKMTMFMQPMKLAT